MAIPTADAEFSNMVLNVERLNGFGGCPAQPPGEEGC